MYRVEFSEACCLKYFDKLPKDAKIRILKFIEERLALYPHEIGEPLRGTLSGSWKARVGEYRIIYQIQSEKIVVLIVKIGNRKNVYL